MPASLASVLTALCEFEDDAPCPARGSVVIDFDDCVAAYLAPDEIRFYSVRFCPAHAAQVVTDCDGDPTVEILAVSTIQ